MRQKDRSFLYLLTFTMLLFSFSSLFAAVTVTYNPASFPYNSTGQQITATVAVTGEPIAAFDLMTKVKSTVTNAFGTVTAVNVSSVPGTVADLLKVRGGTEDTTRIYGFGCNTPTIMPVGNYIFTFTVTTSCDTGAFVLEDGGDWLVDPDPVFAKTAFVNTNAEFSTVTVVPGTYRVFNTAPVIDNCPSQALVVNACAILNYQFQVTDPDHGCLPAPDLLWTIVSGPGMINGSTGAYMWDPPAVAGICGLHQVQVKVTDEYGAFAICDFQISVVSDAPSFTFCPTKDTDSTNIWDVWGNTLSGVVHAVDPDAVSPSNGCPLPLAFSLVSFTGPGTFTVDPVTGAWSWPTVFGDPSYTGIFTAVIKVADGCHEATCSFNVQVTRIAVKIAKIEDQLQGHYAIVPVTIETVNTDSLGGFDLLIAYDASALTLMEATQGPAIAGWEYFTYRFGANGNCNGPCPSGLVRVVALADMNNGPWHPAASAFYVNGVVANLKFLVTNDRTYDCQYVPVAFYWMDCGDNVISDKSGVYAFLSRYVFWYHGPDWVRIDNIQDDGYAGWTHIEGHPNCLNLPGIHKQVPLPWADFYDGGVDIICSDSIDARGDINLNGIANEIADAVLYTNYFLHGITAFPALGREGAIAASDVNADGRTLTVGDLVYLLRIIIGDAYPYAKLAPYGSDVDVSVFGDKISTNSSDNIGALYMTFDVTGDNFTVANLTNMEVVYSREGDKLNVLVYSGMSNMRNTISAGNNELLSVTGATLSSVEVADYYGNMMTTRVEKTALPTQFALHQNIPNPFNPSTKIGLDLPSMTDWKIDIYNVNGQLVQSYNGTNIGHVEVTWDASNTASGVYFYKVSAGSFNDTKKMVLMK